MTGMRGACCLGYSLPWWGSMVAGCEVLAVLGTIYNVG